MKTLEEVNAAREMFRTKLQLPDLSDEQMILLAGMLNALVWVADGRDCGTINDMLAGKPLTLTDLALQRNKR